MKAFIIFPIGEIIMKRLFTSVFLFAAIFCLTSCSSPMSGSTTRENGLSRTFGATATITLDKLTAEGTITRRGEGEWTAEFESPNSLSGVKLTFSGGMVTADYKGLTFSVPKSALPVKAMLNNLIDAVDTNSRTDELHGRENEGYFEISGTLDSGDYTLLLDGSGNIAAFDMPNNLLHISFTDVHSAEPTLPTETSPTDTTTAAETAPPPETTSSAVAE